MVTALLLHATVIFTGAPSADLFSRECAASLDGVLKHNFISRTDDPLHPPGFIRASPEPQPWFKTFWTRDGGTFLRELVKWGYRDDACTEARCLMQLVGRNAEGYQAFPRYFDSRTPRSGEELDGTSAIIIGLTLLESHLPAGHPVKAEIYAFLHNAHSPVAFLEHTLGSDPLLAGQGEFGGGMGIKGRYDNVVQNQLSALALRADAAMERRHDASAAAAAAQTAADTLSANLLRYLVASDGTWIWCIDPKTLRPDPRILHSTTNEGFGGIDGVLSMYADVGGLRPLLTAPRLTRISEATFEKLYATPDRKRQFDRYGIWTQFDRLGSGVLTSPSYGQGYAIQDLLLTDHLDQAAHALDFLAQATYRPVEGYELHRASPYYFYERLYSPEVKGKQTPEVGCGALNLVNVAEPLKDARLIVGLDDTDPAVLRLIPRLPTGWTGYDARHWPVVTSRGLATVSINVRREGTAWRIALHADQPIPHLIVRAWNSNGGWRDLEFHDRTDVDQSNETAAP